MADSPYLIRMRAVIPMKTETGGRTIWEELIGDFREMLFIMVPKKERNTEARERAGKFALSAVRIATRFPDLGGVRFVLRRKIIDFYPFGSIGVEPFTEVIGVAFIAPRFQKATVALHRRPF